MFKFIFLTNCQRVALLFLVSASPPCFASWFDYPVGLKVGFGKSSLEYGLGRVELEDKGYEVVNFRKDRLSDASVSLSLSYAVSPKFSADVSVLSLGSFHTSLDIDLPEGVSLQQVAKDIEAVSTNQAGGMLIALGGSYIQPVYSILDLRLGAGYLFGKDSHDVIVNDEIFSFEKTTQTPYLRFGVGVKATELITLVVNAERYFFEEKVNRYELGIKYNFK